VASLVFDRPSPHKARHAQGTAGESP